jgi:hypothetical protein
MNRIAKPMPAASDHAPLSVLNRSTVGIRTMVVCSCEWMPDKPPQRGSTRSNAHMAHRRMLGLPRADYAATVFGEGPFMGLTWDQWHAEHGVGGTDPYTGSEDEWAVSHVRDGVAGIVSRYRGGERV